jgi:hypothetical protein
MSFFDDIEYDKLIEIAKEQQLAGAIAKIDKFNEVHDVLIREIERQNSPLDEVRKKLQKAKRRIRYS